jgi:NYN domain
MTEPFSADRPAAGSRHAILVDVGYLYAAVGLLVLGTTSRRAFRVAADGFITALIERAAKRVPGELLRMYWYDAARDRVPTVEQRQIAALPHVKVRLGNLNAAGQQKGVDAQVRQDLEVLARHRAVSDVVLIAGDEDMVSAVEAAQAFGVRVHVWGVEPPYGVNQAERLVWEADTVDELDAESARPYVTAEPGFTAAPRPSAPTFDDHGAREAAATAAAMGGTPSSGRPIVPTPASVFATRRPSPQPGRLGPDRRTMEEIGEHIAGKWLINRGRDNVADLLPGPVLPTVIDKELLVEAEQHLNRSLRPFEDARRALRDGFWARLHREFGLSVGVSPHSSGIPAQAAPPAAAAASAPAPAAAAPAPAVAAAPAPAGAAAAPAAAATGAAPAASQPAEPAPADGEE